jgi:hypothetical protein
LLEFHYGFLKWFQPLKTAFRSNHSPEANTIVMLAASDASDHSNPRSAGESFLVLFLKKELLPFTPSTTESSASHDPCSAVACGAGRSA